MPGEYSQMAFMPLGKPYQLTETGFTFQGIGLGGNSMFNGMLFQTNPPTVFDGSWPAGWHWADMQPYFARVRSLVPVTNTPSTDGAPQLTGPAMIAHPLYARAGWIEGDTSQPFTAPGIYSRPYVATTKGHRAGPISGYFCGNRSGRGRRIGTRRFSVTPRPIESTSIRPAPRLRCITHGAPLWTSRSRARRARHNCALADCW